MPCKQLIFLFNYAQITNVNLYFSKGGCGDSLATCSVVAGVWSCMYSLGEVIGPSLGGFLLQYYGFPITATVMASMTLVLVSFISTNLFKLFLLLFF